jgi:hypothetical protein
MKYNRLKLKANFANFSPPSARKSELAAKTLNYIAQISEQNFEHSAAPPPEDFRSVEIYIDDRSLIEIVREAEKPFVAAENEERKTEEGFAENPLTAGDYSWLPESFIYPPSRNLLGEAYDAFILAPGDMHYGKSILLGCTCGIVECWCLAVKITLSEETVTWSDFGQFHREWDFKLKPFVFERKQYESELKKRY